MGVQQPIPIQLDKLRHFKFDLRALALAEREIARFSGRTERVSIATLFGGGEMLLSDLCILAWAGLLHEDRDLTLDAAWDLLSAIDLRTLSTVVGHALSAHMGLGTAQEGAAGDPPTPPMPSGSGSTSGPSGGSTST